MMVIWVSFFFQHHNKYTKLKFELQQRSKGCKWIEPLSSDKYFILLQKTLAAAVVRNIHTEKDTQRWKKASFVTDANLNLFILCRTWINWNECEICTQNMKNTHWMTQEINGWHLSISFHWKCSDHIRAKTTHRNGDGDGDGPNANRKLFMMCVPVKFKLPFHISFANNFAMDYLQRIMDCLYSIANDDAFMHSVRAHLIFVFLRIYSQYWESFHANIVFVLFCFSSFLLLWRLMLRMERPRRKFIIRFILKFDIHCT